MSARRVTSQNVAELAGVSRTTVSLVLNEVPDAKISPATRQKVLDAARLLGYVPDAAAQALVSRRAQTIGLLFIRQPDHIASDAFIPPILGGLVDVIHQHDMRLLVDVIDPGQQKDAYQKLVWAKRIDGILLSGPMSDIEALRTLQDEHFPIVVIGQLPGSWFCSVDIDNCAAAEKAVAHLIQLGHTRIACITNAPQIYTAAAERLRGYQKAMIEAGLELDPALVRYGDFVVESGYLQMRELLASGAFFTAAFVASDTVALGAKAAIREFGLRIPEDIALVGFDDLPFAQYTNPPLTTVHIPVADLARRASQILIQLLGAEQPECSDVILETHLVVRDSCGARLGATR